MTPTEWRFVIGLLFVALTGGFVAGLTFPWMRADRG